jgi:serine/threonine protein kinase
MLELAENERTRSAEQDHQGAVSALLADLARAPPAGSAPPSAPPLATGTVIGRFELVRELGRGGFGVVYEARDRQLGREVALKLVPCAAGPHAAEERAVHEAEAAANLLHPNVVTLFDVGRCEHGVYLVLELLRGRTLSERLAEGPLPPREALQVGLQAARGLAHAHAHGVVHRDLSPGNLFLCQDGSVKLLDFGLARAFGAPHRPGGTRTYMAPEQRRGAPEDERTDVFALGLVMHRMITGELPERPRRGRPRIAEIEELPGLTDTLGDMLEMDPVDRPRDGTELVAALEAIEAGAPPVRPPAPRRRMLLSTQVAIALGAATLGVGAGSALLVRGPRVVGSRPPAASAEAPRAPAGAPEARRRESAVTDGRAQAGAAVTSSLEAYRHYLLGLEAARVRFDSAQALLEFRRALAIDPHFALPQLEIALLASWHEAPGEDSEARIAAAAAEADRLPDKERRTILAFRSLLLGDLPDAVARGRSLAIDYPTDLEALYVAGEALWHGGTASGPAEAADLFRRALDLDPPLLVAAIHLYEWIARFGPADEAVARARRAVQVAPGPVSEAMLARALAMAGDTPRAIALARRASESAQGTSFEASYALAEVLAHAGRFAQAERELRRWTGPDAEGGDRRVALEYLPVLLATQGRRTEALAAWKALTAERCGPDCDVFDARLRVHLALAGGDDRAALAALRALPPELAAHPEVDQLAWMWALAGDPQAGAAHAARLPPGSSHERRYAGIAALQQGRYEDAAEILRDSGTHSPSLESTFLLGLALVGAEREEDAIEAFDALDHTYPFYAPAWDASLRPWAMLQAALARERLGRLDEARAGIQRLLARWAHADRDLPLLADARAAARRLGVPLTGPATRARGSAAPGRPPDHRSGAR